jgi:hypothetical protein
MSTNSDCITSLASTSTGRFAQDFPATELIVPGAMVIQWGMYPRASHGRALGSVLPGRCLAVLARGWLWLRQTFASLRSGGLPAPRRLELSDSGSPARNMPFKVVIDPSILMIQGPDLMLFTEIANLPGSDSPRALFRVSSFRFLGLRERPDWCVVLTALDFQPTCMGGCDPCRLAR